MSMGSEKRFGYEWQKYHQINPDYEIQFKKWIAPFKPEIFQGKKVLDAGCGMGRNSYWPLKYGARKLIAFDYDQKSVKTAQKNLNPFRNARVELKNIYEINYQNEFDVVFSIGVIHHLENPDLAVGNLIQAAKLGGLVLIWVYGYENNEWIVRWISPLRIYLTSKLPLPFLHWLTYFFSWPFWAFIKLIPQKSLYLKQVSQFKFFHVHSIIFDQLLPKIANYYKKEEAYQLLAKHNLKDVKIIQVNGNSWTVSGYK